MYVPCVMFSIVKTFWCSLSCLQKLRCHRDQSFSSEQMFRGLECEENMLNITQNSTVTMRRSSGRNVYLKTYVYVEENGMFSIYENYD